ncbi:hypothetical protein F8388_004666 [Cannabis sativa]|uniref:Phosphofructokinase domain-containing protein n=1 Tax=Cannabis sativa TaxID=3483 RepID=A0A7J6DWD1_CANSA|nr:hypothetical protein F8388_004666 [Cannabis sativa]
MTDGGHSALSACTVTTTKAIILFDQSLNITGGCACDLPFMDTISHSIIAPKLTIFRYGLSPSKHLTLRSNSTARTNAASRSRVSAGIKIQNPPIDFSDPDWKSKFQSDFEKRFNLPHITDTFPDAEPIPSTFCLKMRTPVTEEFRGGYPSDEEWHGYINNNDRVLLKTIYYSSPTSAGAECIDPDCTWVEQWVHRAGPREKIYFKPEEVKAAIVTCGGLCPGLNDVIRQIVITLEIYGVKKIVGIPYGYRGFSDKELAEMPLTRKVVQNVHLSGGSLLGVSRGGPGISEIVDSMEERGINMLFVLGGNGTHAGANIIHKECCRRGVKVAVVGVPKTIDNDILLMDKTFGFDTAVEEAQRAINSAYIEAHSAFHGIGIVKLMGRSSGFIAMHASLASGQIDICLIPEVPFHLHGPHGVLRHLKYLIETKGSAVVCVAEGAGQDFLKQTNAKDASGNAILGDIGVHLQQETKKYFKEIGITADVKYIDPTYMILISYPRLVDRNSRMWHRCLTSTDKSPSDTNLAPFLVSSSSFPLSLSPLKMEDLSNTLTATLQLTEIETKIHSFSKSTDQPKEDNREEPSAFLAVKLLTTRHFNPDAFKNYLCQMWPQRFSINILEKDSNFYTVEFGYFGDRRRVLIGQPWQFDYNLIDMTPLEAGSLVTVDMLYLNSFLDPSFWHPISKTISCFSMKTW